MRGKYQDNLENMQWFKSFFGARVCGRWHLRLAMPSPPSPVHSQSATTRASRMTRSRVAARAGGQTRCPRLQSRKARGLQGQGQQLAMKMGGLQWAYRDPRAEVAGPRPRAGRRQR